ncbi:MAG: DNA-binding Lrp family transcriptional regulator [Patiriisocius sp.]|jgi:DNA-binding Lrp family transcriptional regulator
MTADPLTILFGSQARVKLLRFFLFNPSKEFTFDDISKRARLVRRTARTEMTALEKAGVIKKKQIYVPKEEGSDAKVRVQGYALDKSFPELQALQTFLFETAPINGKTVLKHLRKVGVLDFVVVAGIFVRDFEQRLDILLAMKKLTNAKIENAIRSLESELGVEIRFAAFSSEDLVYRVGMYDKLTRDVFDYPHQILVDKIAIKDELPRG